ncbi:unnamed protein product, partial [Durusdinium trenchii]
MLLLDQCQQLSLTEDSGLLSKAAFRVEGHGEPAQLWWHANKEVLVTVAWSWENSTAAICPVQVIMYAIHHLGKLVSVRWDVYHRSIRDVKLSLLHSCNGRFLQAQMYSQYLWALSYRPYNSSGFHEDKIRILEVMLARENPETFPLFHDMWETIRDDLQMPASSTMHDVWRKLPTTPIFGAKMSMPKPGRWFSWNQCCEEQLSSWHVLKLALQYHFPDNQDVDPDLAAKKRELDAIARMADTDEKVNARKQFSLLKEKLGGGLKLVYYLMSTRLLQQVLILSM